MKTENVTLRSFKTADQEQILDILTSEKVNRTYMLPDYKTRNDAIPLFRRLMELSVDRHRFVRCIAVEDTAIGFVNDVEIKDESIELGYVIHPDYQGRGYMTQALKMAVAELFSLGYTEVVAGAFEDNIASIRVMEKARMDKLDKTERIEYHGKIHRCIYFHAVGNQLKEEK